MQVPVIADLQVLAGADEDAGLLLEVSAREPTIHDRMYQVIQAAHGAGITERGWPISHRRSKEARNSEIWKVAMTDKVNPQWSRHLEGIADELQHLAVACDVRLRDPGVIERIIRDDSSVCGRKNEVGFQKLRRLVMATFDSLGKAIDRIGPDETKAIIDAITEHLEKRRDSTRSSTP